MSDFPRPTRLLHTMLRVSNLDASIAFYTENLGFTLLRRVDNEPGQFTLAFLGYGPESEHAALELTYNWDNRPYDLGTAYGHIALAAPDIYKTCEALAAKGVKVPRPAGPMKGSGTVIAFIEDPDGYKIELIQRN